MMGQRTTPGSINKRVFKPPLPSWSLGDQPIPLVRIYTCGGLRIEVLQQPTDSHSQAHYGPPPSRYVAGNGIIPAQILLKHLVSAPHRHRSLDWLQEYWYGTDENRIPTRMDNRASVLRGILCPSYLQGEQRDLCRKQLVSPVTGSTASGNGYRLGAYPLIWIDSDALDWNVQQACRMERYGDNSLPFWERAYQLASQGAYLPEEEYSDWTELRQSAVRGALRQSVHALKRLYLLQYGEQGQAEVIRLLRDYLLQFPTDEDALRSLVELLGQQERFQEAKQIVERTQHFLKEEGENLDACTVDLSEYLRTKQISRQRIGTNQETNSGERNIHHELLYPSFKRMIAEGVSEGIAKALARVEQRAAKEENPSP